MTDGLVEFLRARLDEDEEVARAALPGPWAVDELRPSVLATDDSADVYMTRTDGSFGGVATDHEGFGACSKADAKHIARHDPARVLAEVEATRQIIDLWQTADTMFRDAGGESGAIDDKIRFWSDRAKALADALRLLALPHTDHPDYRDEWKP